MKKLILSFSALSVALIASASTPLWLRDAKISPDGDKIAFTYKGDIYTVSANGGQATRVTSQPSYETSPVWSPDSKLIAFASDRNGNFDIYIVPADGGKAKRLTYNSASETPQAFTPDGKAVLFSAAIQDTPKSAQFPSSRMTEVYSVPVNGGNPRQLISTPAVMIDYAPDGSYFLYEDIKGYEDEWRKHHTSSVTRDIWKYNVKTGKHTNLTNRPGEDRNPAVSPDGNTVYFLSERDGKSMNVYSMDVNAPSQVSPVTTFKTHPVRFLSQADNGTLAFTYDGEIYTLNGKNAPQKVNITIINDDETPIETIRVGSVQDAVPSPDGKQIAFVSRGEVFVTSTDYNTTKQITHTPATESDITWGDDNRTLVYTSLRDGHANLYEAKIARKEDLNFPNATTIEEKPLFNAKDGVERGYPSFSPDGKQLAFIQDRNKLMVMDTESKKVRQITDGSTYPTKNGGFYYVWSPDSRWIAFENLSNGHYPYSDIAIVNTTGEPHIVDVTRSSYEDAHPRWAPDGSAVLFETERYGMRSQASWGSQSDIMIAFLTQDAYDKFRLSKEDYELLKELEKQQKEDKDKATKGKDDKKDSAKDDKKSDEKKDKDCEVKVEDGITERIVRLTPYSGTLGDFIVTNDNKTLYYLASGQGRNLDLWKMDLREGDNKVASKGIGMAYLSSDKKGDNFFILGGRDMKVMKVSSEKITPVTYSASIELDPAAERDFMFDYVKQEAGKRFYRKDMHGLDWDKMVESYRKFMPHIANNYDFAELLSELLGELNASHTGGRYRPALAGSRTASLGLLYDMQYTGNGLKIAEIVENGPFDHANTLVVPGVIIEKINSVTLNDTVSTDRLLDKASGKKTLVSLYNPADGKRWEEVVLPVSAGTFSDLMYKRWVKQRAADVDRWSNGRLGYVHIESMDNESYQTIYADILGKYIDKEGIVIDTRWNGGGRLHEDIEVLFSGDKYLTQEIRGTRIGDMPSRRWNKPSIMVQNESNYSNAHGTPWVYKYNKLGKLVGAPVPGTMSSVNWITMQDPTMVFGVPVVGFKTAQGNYLENTQLEPDVYILNNPEVIVTGEDQQLHRAVEELLKDIDKK